eukprot:1187388-Prorocentrum_minimum.AAC.5
MYTCQSPVIYTPDGNPSVILLWRRHMIGCPCHVIRLIGHIAAHRQANSLLWTRLFRADRCCSLACLLQGVVQLDARFPANFLGGLGMVPGVAGVDIEALLKEALPKRGEAWPKDDQTHLIDMTSGGQRIEVLIDGGA